MNGTEQHYTLIVCGDGGQPSFFHGVRSDEDLVEKFIKCREDKFSYFRWNKGCIPMRNIIGVMIQ